MPEKVEPGAFQLVFAYDALTDRAEAMEIQFTWDEGTTATFRYDAWAPEDAHAVVLEVNSWPRYGWASWVNEEDALIAFSCPNDGEEGWARIPGAPASDEEDPNDGMHKPHTWVEFAKKIFAVGYDLPLPGMTREIF